MRIEARRPWLMRRVRGSCGDGSLGDLTYSPRAPPPRPRGQLEVADDSIQQPPERLHEEVAGKLER